LPKEPLALKITKDRENRRAKHTRLEVNRKRGDFPLKATNTSNTNDTEIFIATKHIDRTIFNQHTLLIKPKTLREIIGNPTYHQKVKDAIRNALASTGKGALNMIYPLLLYQKVPNEEELQPFPRPNEKIIQKLFDLFDVENVDVIANPVALDDRYEMEWATMGAEIFSNRKADFLNEYALTGVIPNSVSAGTAQSMAAVYLRNGFESLTFDFASQRLREGRMRDIIDGIPDWNKLLVIGTNVPYFNWHGTFRNPIMPMYDLLVSVYGFDSFSGISVGYGGEPDGPEKIAGKMTRKRYCLADTYGAYTKAGLITINESMKVRCNCPICRSLSSPVHLYERDATQSNLTSLTEDLKIHRLHVTHHEIGGAFSLIDKGKYHDYLLAKKAASNELQSILSALGTST